MHECLGSTLWLHCDYAGSAFKVQPRNLWQPGSVSASYANVLLGTCICKPEGRCTVMRLHRVMCYMPLHMFAPVRICVGVCMHEYLCVSVSLHASQEK